MSTYRYRIDFFLVKTKNKERKPTPKEQDKKQKKNTGRMIVQIQITQKLIIWYYRNTHTHS